MKVFIEQNSEPNKKNVFDKATGKYSKTVDFHLTYPYAYGYILDTLASDGDELDCYIITEQKFEHSAVIECEPIGMVEYFEDGEADHKMFVVPAGEVGTVTEDVKSRLLEFDDGYFKGQPNKNTKVGDFLGKEAAVLEITQAELAHQTT
jgi:inorganic pyrophosphatase